jgi:cytoskeletal protein RodZ
MARNKKDHPAHHHRAATFLRSTFRCPTAPVASFAMALLLVVVVVVVVVFVAPSSFHQQSETAERVKIIDNSEAITKATAPVVDTSKETKTTAQEKKEEELETTTTTTTTPTPTWQELVDHAARSFLKKGDWSASPEARAACERYVPSWILQLRPGLEKKV